MGREDISKWIQQQDEELLYAPDTQGAPHETAPCGFTDQELIAALAQLAITIFRDHGTLARAVVTVSWPIFCQLHRLPYSTWTPTRQSMRVFGLLIVPSHANTGLRDEGITVTFTPPPQPATAPSCDDQEMSASLVEAWAFAPLPGHVARWPDTSTPAGSPGLRPPPPSVAAPNAGQHWSVLRWGSADSPAGDTPASDYSPRAGETEG